MREIEERIQRSERFGDLPVASRETPAGVPSNYGDHMDLMFDLLAIAYQANITRVATFMMAREVSNRTYPQVGVPDGHHDLSHHNSDEVKLAKIAKINTFHTTQFAYFLEKLKAVKEGDGTLLDHCAIMYGSGLADGNRHAHHDLPILLAGRGGGRLTAIAFNCVDSDLGHALLTGVGSRLHFAGCIRANTWQGRTTAQLVIDDAAVPQAS